MPDRRSSWSGGAAKGAPRRGLLHLDRHLVHRQLLARAPALRARGLEGLEHVHALDHLAEDGVLAVEPRGWDEGQEELAAIGAGGTGVGHREQAALAVPDVRAELARELVAGPAGAGAERATALRHEARDHAMED